MSGNNSTSISCVWGKSEQFDLVADYFQVFIYYYLTSAYIVIGCTGHLILLAAFYKQSRQEKAYGYQVIYSVSKTLEIFAFGTFLLADVPLKIDGYRLTWFNQSYWLTLIFGQGGFVSHLTFIICSLLLAVSMAADRVFAMTSPVRYKSINHTLHQAVSAVVCFGIGLWGGGIYFAAVRVTWLDDHWTPELITSIDQGPVGEVSEKVRIFSRTLGILALWILDYTMVHIFRKRVARVASMQSGGTHLASSPTQDQPSQQSNAKRAKERTLLWINIYQACSMLLNQMPHVTWIHILPHFASEWRDCYGSVVGPACDAMLMITDMLDFFLVIAINKKMRQLVRDLIPKLGQGSWFSS